MSDNAKVGWPEVAVGIFCAAAGLITLFVTIYYVTGNTQITDKWQLLGIVAGAAAVAFAVVVMLRFALAPLIAPMPPTPKPPGPNGNDDTNVRNRIAVSVLTTGTIAIVGLALVLIVAFAGLAYFRADVRPKVDTLMGGVFTTVLPVIATWVGTVLAFYFGSENFRQAAQSTREALGDRLAAKKTVAQAMKHYDNIAKFEVADVNGAEDGLSMLDMIHTFSDAAPRVIIFNKSKTPIYVIRSASPPMPPGWVKPDFTEGDALKELEKELQEGSPAQHVPVRQYLDYDGGKNRDNARKFRFISADATVDEALALMKKEDVDDLFITKDGQPASPVLGWAAMKDLASG